MSGSSGRYQSRLFNLINQQTRWFADECARTLRQVKVATTWSAQIFLYPFYALFEAARQASKNLLPGESPSSPPQQESRVQPQPPVAADTPLLRVLEAARSLSLPEDFVKQFPAADSPSETEAALALAQQPRVGGANSAAIRGFATLLATQTLVLVAGQNQIVNILTPQQQLFLEQQISREVDDYWRIRQQATPPSAPADREDNISPVRLFANVKAWIQTNPIAAALSRFGQSSLVWQQRLPEAQQTAAQENSQSPNPPIQAPLPNAQLPKSYMEGEIIHPLPRLVKKWEPPIKIQNPIPAGALAILERTVTVMAALSLPAVSAITTAVAEGSAELLQRAQKPFIALVTDSPAHLKPPEPGETAEANSMQALIRSAINYFFGERGEQLSGGAADAPASQLSAASDAEADIWLTDSDIFGQQTPAGAASAAPVSNPEGVPAGRDAGNPVGRYWQSVQKFLPDSAKDAGEGVPSAPALPNRAPQPTAVSHTPDWIEAEVTWKEYIKHPLEVLLEWLDRAMLWLEQTAVKIWQWVRLLIGVRG
jgi:hypothetical protein